MSLIRIDSLLRVLSAPIRAHENNAKTTPTPNPIKYGIFVRLGGDSCQTYPFWIVIHVGLVILFGIFAYIKYEYKQM